MEDGGDTRSRLLETAGEVFAEEGFRLATVRDICSRAGANVAAVNYHFGGKEQLYRAVLEYSFQYANERYPMAMPGAGVGGGVNVGGPAGAVEARFRLFVSTSLERMLDAGKPAWHGKLIMREFSEPTGELDAVAERFMKPHFAMLLGLVEELVGPAVPEERVRLLALSTMGQITFYKTCREAVCRLAPEVTGDPEQRRRIANHIADVMLAATRTIRAEADIFPVTDSVPQKG